LPDSSFFSIFIPVNELKNTYFMQTNNEYQEGWPVRPYSKRELAMAYAPDISPSSALNRLAGWVRHHRRLSDELDETGYQNRQRIFTSLQVELIFRYLGRP
jgi:hypothetical protein